jgi:5-formyltetrahydrofolate cyclo-ligase
MRLTFRRELSLVLCYNPFVDIGLEKKLLREKVRRKVAVLTVEEKAEASKKVFLSVTALPAYQQAKSCMFYASTSNEVDTFSLMEDALGKDKQVWVPWCEVKTVTIIPVRIRNVKRELSVGAYGIYSPDEPTHKEVPADFRPEIVFVPGAVFDTRGNRLGRGLGYYDKFLSRLPKETLKIGLAFECQMSDEVPIENFDVPLNKVIINE